MLLVLGLFIIGIGIINMLGNISTIHSYNRRNVKEEDVAKYGRMIGGGTIIIGLGAVLSFIMNYFNENIASYLMVSFIIIGIVIILFGQIKYNKGIF